MEYICPFEDNHEFSSSSGCESGWTFYLGNDSSVSPQVFSSIQEHDFFAAGGRNRVYHDEEEDDEDLSMVSDASSGPPQYLNEEDSYGSTGKDNDSGGCFYHRENVKESALSEKNLKSKKIEENRRRIKDINEDHRSSSNLFDDTASSPLFGFSNERFTHTRSSQASTDNELDYSQGYSTTHDFDGKAHNYHETHDFLQSPVSGNQLYQNQWFEWKRW